MRGSAQGLTSTSVSRRSRSAGESGGSSKRNSSSRATSPALHQEQSAPSSGRGAGWSGGPCAGSARSGRESSSARAAEEFIGDPLRSPGLGQDVEMPPQAAGRCEGGFDVQDDNGTAPAAGPLIDMYGISIVYF